jgi:hypothetical protein
MDCFHHSHGMVACVPSRVRERNKKRLLNIKHLPAGAWLLQFLLIGDKKAKATGEHQRLSCPSAPQTSNYSSQTHRERDQFHTRDQSHDLAKSRAQPLTSPQAITTRGTNWGSRSRRAHHTTASRRSTSVGETGTKPYRLSGHGRDGHTYLRSRSRPGRSRRNRQHRRLQGL